jgi:homoserine O-acetyltransferase/O-succinyltransferase
LPRDVEEGTMSDFDTFDAPDFALQKGGSLPLARLAYKTLGKLSPARDNVVVIPSWYTGTHKEAEFCMVGPQRAITPDRYFIIMTNLLAGGVSSSPDNTPAPHDGPRFPRVTLHDNVRLQHMLVTEKFGIERIRLVAGWSMGACQSFQWGAQYADMVEAMAPICGAARTANFNKVFLLSLRRALELDPAFDDGFYRRPPLRGLKAFAGVYAGWGFSEPFYRTEAFRQFNAETYEEFVEYFWEPGFIHRDANNLLSQLWTWHDGDISDGPAYHGDLDQALAAIKARTIILPCQYDSYFPPVDSEYEASRIPGAKCRPIPSIWGHMTLWNPEDASFIDRSLHELLGTG